MRRFSQKTVFPLPDPPAIPTTVTALDAPGGGGGDVDAARTVGQVVASRVGAACTRV